VGAAAARAEAVSDSAVHTKACGMVARYNKYLVNDYSAEFDANLRTWASGLAIVSPAVPPEPAVALDAAVARPEAEIPPPAVPPAPADAPAPAVARPDAAQAADDLQAVYGKEVVPDEVLRVLNNGFDNLEHCVPPGKVAECEADPVAYKQRQVEALYACLRARLLVISEHPTHTRMFSFKRHMDALLLLTFLEGTKLREDMLRLHTTQPREDNAKRLRVVSRWLRRDDVHQYLRRTALCLRVTAAVHNMSAKTRDTGKDPMVVRFARGEVQDAIDNEVIDILSSVSLDPALDVAPAVTAVLGTACDLLNRFARYQTWPYLTFLMVKEWNPHFARSCRKFLCTPAKDLDVGFGAELQAEALRHGGLDEQMTWLQSRGVQDVLTEVGLSCLATSLPAEREFATVKKQEQSKVSFVGTAGQNVTHRRILRKRIRACEALEQAEQRLRSAKKLRIESIAMTRLSDLQAVPAVAPVPAVALVAAAAPDAADTPDAAVAQGSIWPSVRPEEVREYTRSHAQELERVLQDELRAAEQGVKDATPDPDFPCTEGSWLAWMGRRLTYFREKMITAPDDLKLVSRRLYARGDMPEAVARLQPKESIFLPAVGSWGHLLERRTGWFGVAFEPPPSSPPGAERSILLLYVCLYEGATSCLTWDLSEGEDGVLLPTQWAVSTALVPLKRLVQEYRHKTACGVFEPVMVAEYVRDALIPSIRMRCEYAQEVSEPLQRKKGAAGGEGESEDGDDDEAPQQAPPLLAGGSRPDGGSRPSGGVRPTGGTRPKRSPESESDDTASVDTDKESDGSSGSESDDVEAAKAAANLGARKTGKRSAPMRERVWEDEWCYITHHKCFRDCKVAIKNVFLKPLQMGKVWPSKALTPTAYGETRAKPARTHCLLRAWVLWRARQFGWIRQRDCRIRQEAKTMADLVKDIRAADGREDIAAPIFKEEKAHKLFQKRAPDLVKLVLAA